MIKGVVTTLVLWCAFLLAPAAAAQVVTVYTSANFAPLMLADGRGIYPDLVAYLNRLQPGGLRFKLAYLPRKRLQVKLEEGSIDGIIIGMMPEWFGDTGQTKFLWTAPFAVDRYVLVSGLRRKLDPAHPASLPGATVGVTQGYVYPVIDPWLARHGVLRRDGVSDQVNLEKVLLDRLDGAIVSESMARYFLRSERVSARLRLEMLPGPGTERRFMMPHAQAAVYKAIAPAIKKLKDDPAWQRITAGYN
jgi:polar amino acid transport system substrate-binding protein